MLLLSLKMVKYAVATVVVLLCILAYWMIFKKAGEAGWKALIPVYSTYIEYKLTWSGKMFGLLAVFAVCLVINLLSAGIPAYRASRMKIINSLNQNDN